MTNNTPNSAGHSDATRSSYDKNWKVFDGFCSRIGRVALPASPHTVQLLIGGAAAGEVRSGPQTGAIAPATLDVILSAVRQKHLSAGYASPTADPAVKAQRVAYRRAHSAPPRKAVPLTVDGLDELSVARTVDTGCLAAATASLVAVELECSIARLARVTVADVGGRDRTGHMTMMLAGELVQGRCSCGDLCFDHWPHAACPACLLDDLAARAERTASRDSVGVGTRRESSTMAPKSRIACVPIGQRFVPSAGPKHVGSCR